MKLIIIDNPRPLTLEHINDVANAPLSACLNSGYAMAVARRAGWEAVYLDFTASNDPTMVAEDILAEDADLILFHWVYAWGHEALVRDAMALVRRASAAPLGAFGLFPTLAGARLFEFAPDLDFILAGEFEATLVELLNSTKPIKSMPGLLLPGKTFTPRPLLDDLSLLPAPDDVGSNLNYASLSIAASRGCYGDCSFCFIKPYYGCSRRRTRTAASLEKELEIRLARRPIESLYFIDPTFIAPGEKERERVIAISEIAGSASLPFGFETRVDTVDEKLLAILARNGATSVFLGIESGCDSVLRRVNKQIRKEQIVEAVRIIRSAGLKLNIGFIMFEPDSTLDELRENYDFLEGLGLLETSELTANLLYHNQIVLYGSPAWHRFEREQRLLLDQRLPFEARYLFRDERVGQVCNAMGRLASAYFIAAGRLAYGQMPGNGVNNLLKQAFLNFVSAPGTEMLAEQETIFFEQLRGLISTRETS